MLLGLLFCSTGFAEVLHFKCTEKHSWFNSVERGINETLNQNTLMLLKIDTDKKIMTEFDELKTDFFHKWEINRITDYVYSSNFLIGINQDIQDAHTLASFNRWTGSYKSRVGGRYPSYTYNCEPTKQLY